MNAMIFLNTAWMERYEGPEEDGKLLCFNIHYRPVFYTHPYSSWERGSNENANRLIRRFIPKRADINNNSAEEIRRIEHWMNNYPRKIHGYKSAKEMAA